MSTPEQRMRMAKQIVDFEARRDKKGHLQVYKLPAWDGGGRYEVAGINEKYNKEVCDHLVELIEGGEYDKAEELATEFIASDTDVVVSGQNFPRSSSICATRSSTGDMPEAPRSCKWRSAWSRMVSSAPALARCSPSPSKILLSFSMTFAPRASATSVRWSGATSAASPGKGSSTAGITR
jgi:hypothetical protein